MSSKKIKMSNYSDVHPSRLELEILLYSLLTNKANQNNKNKNN